MKINLQAVVDDAKLGLLQMWVVALCSLIIMIDGYDLAIIGVALPSIISEMKLDPSVAGLVASCALFGMMFGAMILGTLADKIGRVKTIVLCVFIFSVFTAAGGFAKGPISLAALRFIAGLGLGGVIPCITAAVSEYSPKRLRSRLTTLVFAAYPIGGIIAALLGKQFLGTFGWQIVFYAAGVPLVLIPFILKWMPESGTVLQKRNDQTGLRELAKHVDPTRSISGGDEIYVPLAVHHNKVPVARLFQEGRGFSTVMLWISFFSGLFLLYAMNSWLTKLMAMAGYSLGSALTFLMLFNFGSVIGSFSGGWLSDRFNLKPVLSSMLICGAICVALMAKKMPQEWLSILIFIAGMTASGAQGVMNAFTSQFYPADIRSTGHGIALGVGRMGGIAAPIIIGLLISLNLPFEQNFYVIAMFGLLQAVSAWLVNERVADFNASRANDGFKLANAACDKAS